MARLRHRQDGWAIRSLFAVVAVCLLLGTVPRAIAHSHADDGSHHSHHTLPVEDSGSTSSPSGDEQNPAMTHVHFFTAVAFVNTVVEPSPDPMGAPLGYMGLPDVQSPHSRDDDLMHRPPIA